MREQYSTQQNADIINNRHLWFKTTTVKKMKTVALPLYFLSLFSRMLWGLWLRISFAIPLVLTDIPDFIAFATARIVFKKMKAFLGAINVFFNRGV